MQQVVATIPDCFSKLPAGGVILCMSKYPLILS